MILESGGREYGDYAGGFGAGVLQADPRMLRNEHHSSRMQVALLISDMSVDSSFLDKHDLVLLKVLMGWYGARAVGCHEIGTQAQFTSSNASYPAASH